MPGTILIVDDVATNRIVLKVKLAHECYAVLQAATGREALGMVRGRRPDLVLLDVGLPDIDGISVLRAIRSDPAIADLPVLMFTAARDSDLRLTALQAGADGFLDKPLDDAVLVARIRSLLRDRARTDETRAETRAIGLAEDAAGFAAQPHIVLVAARPDTALRWRAVLAPHVAGRLSVATRDEALALSAAPGGPDLYVIGGDAQGRGGGLAMLADLRSRAGSQHAAICVVLPEAGGERAAMAFDLGAGDVLAEGFDGAEAAARLRVLLARKRTADAQRAAVRAGLELAAVDPLTGLWNRRYAMPALARMVAETAGGPACAAMLIDIDRFKAVNDTHGHVAGDAVLSGVARRLRALCDPGALVARIGGEEFLVALPDMAEAAARAQADRIRAGIAAAPFDLPGEGAAGALRVTVSIGVALSADGRPDADGLMAAADQALLDAKAEGRNHVTLGRSAA